MPPLAFQYAGGPACIRDLTRVSGLADSQKMTWTASFVAETTLATDRSDSLYDSVTQKTGRKAGGLPWRLLRDGY